MEYRYTEFAKKYLNMGYEGTSINVKVRCLFHDDSDPSMSFHLDTGQFKCFSCSESGGIIKIARKLGLTIRNRDYIEELDDPDAESAVLLRRLAELDTEPHHPTLYSEKRLKSLQGDVNRTDFWREQRGFTERTIRTWQLGFDRLRNHATIPVRAPFSDQLVGITRRQLNPGAKPKYLDAKGFPKKKTMFGTWAPDAMTMHKRKVRHHDMKLDISIPAYQPPSARSWVLAEGPLDAIKIWQAGYNGRCTMGGELSREQVDILLKYGVETVTLFLDDDKPGFKKAMHALGMLKKDFDVYAAKYDHTMPHDPGDMTEAQIKKAVKEAVSLNTWVL